MQGFVHIAEMVTALKLNSIPLKCWINFKHDKISFIIHKASYVLMPQILEGPKKHSVPESLLL